MIEKAIHEIITDPESVDAALLSLVLPPDRIVTGHMQDDSDLPFATINLESNLPEFRSNKSSVRRPSIRIKLWHKEHLPGCTIRDSIKKLLENKSFKTQTVNVICIRHENDFAFQETDGVWQFVIDFETKTKEGDCCVN